MQLRRKFNWLTVDAFNRQPLGWQEGETSYKIPQRYHAHKRSPLRGEVEKKSSWVKKIPNKFLGIRLFVEKLVASAQRIFSRSSELIAYR